jgi:hypothetical protein
MEPTEKAAHDILATIEATYQPTHHYVPVDPRAFRHLDQAFYDRTARLLASKGFRTLADVEDTTITATPGTVLMPVMIRTLLSRDGTIMAALYHPKIRSLFLRALIWVLRKSPGKIIDMETECSDGSFVVTSNAIGAAALTLPTLISVEYLATKSTVHEIHQRHTRRVAAHLDARTGVRARVITTHAELVASQNRMNAIKAAHRGEIGGVTREELEQLAILPATPTDAVYAALERERLKRAG